jgi:hypothetical protein
MTDESSALEQPYEIVSVRRAEPPAGVEGSNWYKYVIAFEGAKTIRGHRKGSLREVTGELQEIVDQLNERHFGKHGRVHLAVGKKIDA